MAPFLRILGIDDPYGNQNNHNNPCILRHLCLLSGMFPGFEMTFCWAILPFQVGGGGWGFLSTRYVYFCTK
jgi:hypothetical protein